ncbi:MAG TPA: PLP-dependent aminotransferase family protein, partial [Stackebrandtia sp.]|uniref:MocR-like pyridoxine biosynthesis transcription factor PdxR n=1 Tax=Stackebrandtia sp. TaxID=2023065 RepID=UPI002D34A1BF
MDVHISLEGRGDLPGRIYQQLQAAILDGRLAEGARLPATRELAERLGVSRNTVAAAYERLRAEGFVSGRVGAGTYVRGTGRVAAAPTAPAGEVRPRDLWRDLDPMGFVPPSGVPFDFKVGIPDPDLFPLESWRRLVTRELRASATRPGYLLDATGHPRLRTAIARHFGLSRSVRAGGDDVVVTQGAQQALDLIGRVLIEPGDTVAVEEPGYPPARMAFAAVGARVVPVPVDDQGIDTDAIPDAARLVYVTPSHQFPTGVTMSLARRTALLEWARVRDAAIIEDDYDSDYRFGDRPLEPIQCLDRDGRVIYVGTFSKTLLPMLRMGFLIAPSSLRGALAAAKRLCDGGGPAPAQAALARLIDEGLFAAHLRRAGRVYAERHAALGAAIERHLSPWLEPVPSIAGLHRCVVRRPGVDVDIEAVARMARASGVVVTALSAFCAAPRERDGLAL